ncbi:MAG: TIGR02996 domain-containing protein [Planctomycetes bacterium]|nr:TIGR02996 domain-containing protein [Planctomycetota bacterium]
MTDDDAFLGAILENPDDDILRLIYADWLEEYGQPERAELIRVQIALATQQEDSPGHLPLEARERDLLANHQDIWLGTLRPLLTRWTFRRGLLDTVAVPISTYLQNVAIPCPATVRRLEVDLDGFEVSPAILELVPVSLARENIVLPVGIRGRLLVLAVPDPPNSDFVAKMQFILDRYLAFAVASREQILNAIERHYDQMDVEGIDCCCLIDMAIDFGSDKRNPLACTSPFERLPAPGRGVTPPGSASS